MGNKECNLIWESNLDAADKPGPTAKRLVKQQFILAKYVEKKFISKCSMTRAEMDSAFAKAISEKDFLNASKMLIFGANINMMYGRGTLLHFCIQNGDSTCVEFLLQRDCQPNLLDEDECTPLDRAIMSEKSTCIELLISRGAEVNIISDDRFNTFSPRVTLENRSSITQSDGIRRSSVTWQEDADCEGRIKAFRRSSNPNSPKKQKEVPRLKKGSLSSPLIPHVKK